VDAKKTSQTSEHDKPTLVGTSNENPRKSKAQFASRRPRRGESVSRHPSHAFAFDTPGCRGCRERFPPEARRITSHTSFNESERRWLLLLPREKESEKEARVTGRLKANAERETLTKRLFGVPRHFDVRSASQGSPFSLSLCHRKNSRSFSFFGFEECPAY
jgi:hypothetical protein